MSNESIGERLSRLERKVRRIDVYTNDWDIPVGALMHRIRSLELEFDDLIRQVRRLESERSRGLPTMTAKKKSKVGRQRFPVK